ncbi:hypothetical protein BJ912DRAFT_508428 [Pholiota molesta]|nr:hypothetical protein BJ912DRAFT_508428 [Pholiota molesta]
MGHSARKRGYSYQSFARKSVRSRTHHKRGPPHAGDPNVLCKLIPLLCPQTQPNKQDPTPTAPSPPPKSTSNTPVPPSPTQTSSTNTEAPSPTPSSSPPPPPPPSTNSPSPTPTPTVTSVGENSSPSVSTTTKSSNLTPSSELPTTATQQSSDSTQTVISTNSNGQLTTENVVSTVPVPFTTSSGIPLVRTTDSLGSTFTIPYGPDPTQSSFGSETSNTSAAVNGNGAAVKGSDNDIGAVVGGISGAIALLVLLILGFCFIRRRRRAIRTAPSAEFLGQQQYPFSGSAQFLFQRAGSFGSSAQVMDTASPIRELGPDPFGVHSEKAEHAYAY